MRTTRPLLAALLLPLALTACGQKGPLYLPRVPATPAGAVPPAGTQPPAPNPDAGKPTFPGVPATTDK